MRWVCVTATFGSTHYPWDGDLMIHSQRGNKEALFVFEPNSFVPLATVQGISKQAARNPAHLLVPMRPDRCAAGTH